MNKEAYYDTKFVKVTLITREVANRLKHDGVSLYGDGKIPHYGRTETLWLILRALAKDGYTIK